MTLLARLLDAVGLRSCDRCGRRWWRTFEIGSRCYCPRCWDANRERLLSTAGMVRVVTVHCERCGDRWLVDVPEGVDPDEWRRWSHIVHRREQHEVRVLRSRT